MLLSLVVLAACETSPAASHGSQQARPAPPRLIAVLDSPFGSVPNTVRLVGSDGVEAAHVSLREDAEAITVAGSRLLVAGGGRLRAISRGGAVEDLGALPDDTSLDLVRGLVASPDGRRWVWASVRQEPDGTARARIYVAGDGLAPALLSERSEPGRALQPVAWNAAGIVVADEPLGIGGYILFRRAFGPSSLLDVDAHLLRPLLTDECAFSDLAPDGSVACVLEGREGTHGPGPVTLRIISTAGSRTDIALASDVAQAGAALFSPTGDRLSLATSPALANGAEVINAYLLDVRSGARRPIGPAGLAPAGWLDASHLVAARIPGTAGGAVGTYILATDGTATLIATGSTVVGILR